MSTSLRLITLACVLVLSCGVAVANGAVLSVTNTNNTGPGSLRQAILDSNLAPGPNVIEIDLPAGATPNVIMPTGQFLPPLKGPVTVRVKATASATAAPAPARGGGGGRGAAAPPASAAPQAGATPPAGGRAAAAATPIAAAATAVVILDGSKLVKPRTPEDCPGATAEYNTQTNQWENSRVSGTGPNVRGYYGAGLAVHDSHEVEISGFEIRNFCIGVATVRSHDVYIHDMKISENHGAAGVIFTGDDGNAAATSSSYNNMLLNSVLLDNSDGFEFTRGTHDSVLQGNMIALTKPPPAVGNAVEFASAGDNNAVMGNTFTKYVDTVITVSGANQTIRDNTFIANEGAGMRASGTNLLILGNTFSDNGGDAMSVSGVGSRVIDNVVSGNAGKGIVVGSLGVTLTRNSIYSNAQLGIDIAAPGGGRGGGGRATLPGAVGRGAAPQGTPAPAAATPAPAGRGGRGAAPAPPAAGTAQAPAAALVLPDAPVMASTSTWSADAIVLNGSLASKPGQRYAIQLFVSRAADRHTGDDHGWGEGQMYIGTASVTTDASGKGTFSLMLRIPDIFGDGQTTGFFTATATDPAGSTSKFSRSSQLNKR